MKRPATPVWGGAAAPKRPNSSPTLANAPHVLKVLISEAAASELIGKGGSIIREIQASTGARIHISNKGEFYPGSALQEANVQAPNGEAHYAALQQIFSRALEADGLQSEREVSTAVVAPRAAASTVIGKGGGTIKQIRSTTGAWIHVEDGMIGHGDTAEQVITLSGPVASVHEALVQVDGVVNEAREEPFFHEWAAVSHCSAHAEAPVRTGKGGPSTKGRTEGKGKAPAPAPIMAGNNGRGTAAIGSGSRGGGGGHPALDLVAHAMDSVSPDLPDMQGPPMMFVVPESLVSGIIGKGGVAIKEISASTGAKVVIREIDGDSSQKSVQITGPVFSVAAAWVRVVGRIAELEAQGGQGDEPGPYKAAGWS